MDKILPELFHAMFADFDGFELGPLRRVNRWWKSLIDDDPRTNGIVQSRIRWIDANDNDSKFQLPHLRDDDLYFGPFIRTLRKCLYRMFDFDVSAYANFIRREQYLIDPIWWNPKPTFDSHSDIFGRGREIWKLYRSASNASYYYIVSDGYEPQLFNLESCKVLEQCFPNVFSWYIARFNPLESICLCRDHPPSDTVCCGGEIHRGYVYILRINLPIAVQRQQAPTYRRPPIVGDMEKKMFRLLATNPKRVEELRREITEALPEGRALLLRSEMRKQRPEIEQNHRQVTRWITRKKRKTKG